MFEPTVWYSLWTNVSNLNIQWLCDKIHALCISRIKKLGQVPCPRISSLLTFQSGQLLPQSIWSNYSWYLPLWYLALETEFHHAPVIGIPNTIMIILCCELKLMLCHNINEYLHPWISLIFNLGMGVEVGGLGVVLTLLGVVLADALATEYTRTKVTRITLRLVMML